MDLPLDLLHLVQWTLADPFTSKLVATPANSFFAPNHLTSRIGMREDEEGSWKVLPVEWREFFERQKDGVRRAQILKALANGEEMVDFPPSLYNFLHTCKSLSLERTCSNIPIVAYPPRPPIPHSLTEDSPIVIPSHKKKTSNKERAGLSEKKLHEVLQFSALVSNILEQPNAPTHALDVGSGRAHLSRALASPPLALNVLAVDWSASQTSGANLLDSKTIEHIASTRGSLTHRTNSLDAPGITELLSTWPEVGENAEKTMLVALHACGDLTVDALRAFVNTSASGAVERKAVCVGCCYNLMSETNFPMSKLFSTLPTSSPLAVTRDQLRVTPQSPLTWYSSQSFISALSSSIIKIAFRARFEAELDFYGHRGERSIGRVGECSTYEAYRKRALEKFVSDDKEGFTLISFGSSDERAEEEWTEALFYLQVFWTLKSWLGPPLESMLLLDRFSFVVEGLGLVEKNQAGNGEGDDTRRRVELINIFDQATGSMRNVALVVR